MAKQVSKGKTSPARRPQRRSGLQGPQLAAVILAVALVGLLALGTFVLSPQPRYLQLPFGLLCAALASGAFLLATRRRDVDQDVLYRLERGQPLEFGKQLRAAKGKPKTLNLPGLGAVQVRTLGAAGIFAAVTILFFTGLAPVAVRGTEVEDLEQLLANDIAAVILVQPDGALPLAHPPASSKWIRDAAGDIPDRKLNARLRGLKAIALGKHEEGRRLLEEAKGTDDPNKIRVGLAQAALYAGRFKEAGDLLAEAVQAKPDDPALLCQAGAALMHLGKYKEAAAHLDKAAKLCADSGREDNLAALALHARAALNISAGRQRDEAEKDCQRAQDLWSKVLGEGHPCLAASLNNQAVLRNVSGKYSSALSLLGRAQETWKQRGEAEDAYARAFLRNQAAVQYVLGQYEASRGLLEQAPAAGGEDLGALSCAALLARVSEVLLDQAQARYDRSGGHGDRAPFDAAVAKAHDLVAELAKRVGVEHPAYLVAVNALGRVYAVQRRDTWANRLFDEAFSAVSRVYGSDHFYRAACLRNLSAVSSCLGDFSRAKNQADEALRIGRKVLGAGHLDTAAARRLAARAEKSEDLSEWDAIAATIAKALPERDGGKAHPLLAACLLDGGRARAKAGQGEAAAKDFRRSLEMAETLFGKDHPTVADACYALAELYVNAKQPKQAKPWLDQCLKIRQEALPPSHPALADALDLNARLIRLANPDGGEAVQRQAQRVQKQAEQVRRQHELEEIADREPGK